MCQRKQRGASGIARGTSNQTGTEIEAPEEDSQGKEAAKRKPPRLVGQGDCGRRLCIRGGLEIKMFHHNAMDGIQQQGFSGK